jgi:hypothetical protein
MLNIIALDENMSHDSIEYTGYILLTQILRLRQQKYFFYYFNGGHPIAFEFKSKTKCFKVTNKTQQQYINISVSVWRHVSVLLDHY